MPLHQILYWFESRTGTKDVSFSIGSYLELVLNDPL